MSSKAFQNAERLYLGRYDYEVVHDGLHQSDFDALTQDEKKQLEERFLKKLSVWNCRMVKGLGFLRSTAAAPTIRRYLRSLRAWLDKGFRIDVAMALWRIEKYPKSLEIILDLLRNSRSAYIRSEVVYALKEFDGKEIFEVLLVRLYDSDTSVQQAVKYVLLMKCGARWTFLHPFLDFGKDAKSGEEIRAIVEQYLLLGSEFSKNRPDVIFSQAREEITFLLRLIAATKNPKYSDDIQERYKDAPGIFFKLWDDNIYRPERENFKTGFFPEELQALKEFNTLFQQHKALFTKQGQAIESLFSSADWQIIQPAACKALESIRNQPREEIMQFWPITPPDHEEK